MIPGPFSILSSRMLDIHPRQKLLGASPCVAPKDIFSDYSHVIARLTGEGGTFQDKVISVTRTFNKDDLPPYNMNENVCASIHTNYGERGYQESSHAREAATDISNSYSNLAIRKGNSERKSRRPEPYDRTFRPKASSEEADSLRCPYVTPRTGKRCQKVNKSLQERARHWTSCHVFKEAKSILEGRLTIGEGYAITSMAELDKIKQSIQCSHCAAIITRSDSMKRHLKQNCKVSEAS